MIKNIKTLILYYNSKISFHEIPFFRGAVLDCLGEKADLLFHNHTDDSSFRYSYPLIQYKQIDGKAAIVCIDKGIDIVGQLLSKNAEALRIGERQMEAKIVHIQPVDTPLQAKEESISYHIHHWLPLNTKNYHQYQKIETSDDHLTFLENILKANLLAMLKGLSIFIEVPLSVHIIRLSQPRILTFKNIGMTSFNADFTCNLSLPDNIGIGKNASIGCGVIHHIKD